MQQDRRASAPSPRSRGPSTSGLRRKFRGGLPRARELLSGTTDSHGAKRPLSRCSSGSLRNICPPPPLLPLLSLLRCLERHHNGRRPTRPNNGADCLGNLIVRARTKPMRKKKERRERIGGLTGSNDRALMENGTFLVLFQFSVAHGVLGYAL